MRLTTLHLEEFRSYRRMTVDLPPAGLRIFGLNAGGKTSLLEAVYLLATMRSPRASSEREAINWQSGAELGLPPYARVAATVRHNSHETDVEVVLTVDEERGGALRKRVKLDGRPRRAVDAVGALKVVLFTPDDLNLILGSPSIRRRYLDITLSQIDTTYLHALSQYGRLLEQRNSLLKDLGGRRPRDERTVEDQLAYWDGEIITRGAYLLAQRLRYVHRIDEAAAREFEALARTGDRLGLRYSTTVTLPDALRERVVEASLADAQAFVARALESDFHRLRSDELRRGVTLVGPHRDDLEFLLGGHDLSAYGSRGQQRIAVVATKLAELRQVVAMSGERPVLLLDDVLSELDPEHQDRLLAALGTAGCQILITATDRALLDQPALGALPLIEARGGTLVWVEAGDALPAPDDA